VTENRKAFRCLLKEVTECVRFMSFGSPFHPQCTAVKDAISTILHLAVCTVASVTAF